MLLHSDDRQYGALVDLLSLADREFGEDTAVRRGDPVFHLHGLQVQQHLSGFDLLALLGHDPDDGAGHRSHKRSRRHLGTGFHEARLLDERDRAERGVDEDLVRAADELHDRNMIIDATWATLAERFDEAQLIEICMVVGQYHLVAFTLRSLAIQREAGVEGLAE